MDRMNTVVQSHARAIEANLSEYLHLLQLTARTHRLSGIKTPGQIRSLFDNLNSSSNGGFIDLGIIDAEGNHLAYFGPHDLKGRNYRETGWFREVIASGEYISDVFLGFRRVPHCIIAVRVTEEGVPWILRATINSEQFDRLVKVVPLGEGSSAYILNQEGLYQTAPANASVLEKGPLLQIDYHSGIQTREVIVGDTKLMRATTWINNNRWLLVVEQDLGVVQAPVDQAIASGALVVAFAILLLLITTLVATWHLTNRIERANAERDEMSQAFIRSAKLASIGELATGLAHEINNPLAIINAEQTNISDLMGEHGATESGREILESVERSKAQVQRCASITRKMLQFGRPKESRLELTNVVSRLNEIIELLLRRAKVRNIEIITSLEENLPQVYVDPLELEQVFVNLINNAFDALPDGGRITLRVFHDDERLHMEINDNGIGISAEDMEHVFEPFFTTKDVGKGTGLGLSVCYGIVQSWGGSISAESERGKGTSIHILLPLRFPDGE